MAEPDAVAGEHEGAASPPATRPILLALGAVLLAALFAWNVARTWSLGDDAFISFRYAANLADGLGLVWNAGERVEGYTNFSWVLLMAAGIELGLAPEVLSNALGVACGVVLLVALFRFAARGRSAASPVPWLVVGLLVASRSFAAWCTGGLETMLFTLLVFLGWARLFGPWPDERRGALGCALLFALAALTRPEGILFGGLAGAWLVLEVLGGRRGARALAWFAPFALVVAAHFLWRRAYYGEWLPNTFHAKVGGLWLEQGRRYFAYFHDAYRIGWFAPLALLALAGARRREAAAALGVLAVYGAYVLAVGGDLFELRFCVHAFPLFYWLLAEGLAALAGFARAGRAGPVLATIGAAALFVTTWLGFERVPANRYGLQSIEGITMYTRQRVEEGRTLRRFIEAGVLPRDVVLCVGGAGAVPYYTRWTTVDRRGLNDATIARMPVAGRGVVAHEHDAPHEYLVARGVVVFDFFNQLLVKRQGLRSLAKQEPFRHDGHVLTLRQIPLDERALVFATYADEAELARSFPGAQVLPLGGG